MRGGLGSLCTQPLISEGLDNKPPSNNKPLCTEPNNKTPYGCLGGFSLHTCRERHPQPRRRLLSFITCTSRRLRSSRSVHSAAFCALYIFVPKRFSFITCTSRRLRSSRSEHSAAFCALYIFVPKRFSFITRTSRRLRSSRLQQSAPLVNVPRGPISPPGQRVLYRGANVPRGPRR